MIEVRNLTKSYGGKRGVKNLSFTVNAGEVLGFLGPNGAGKSTTMNIITGYRPPTEGRIIIDGVDMEKNPLQAKKRIGYLPEIPPVYPDLKVLSYLRFVSELKGVKAGEREAHLRKIMEMVKISDVADRLIKNLSKGYKQRVGLAQALVSNPDILILDEPTVGLDPRQIIEIRTLIKELGREHTILLSSHILAEVSMICERVIILNKGEIAAVDTPDSLARGMARSERFFARIRVEKEELAEIAKGIEGLIGVELQQEDFGRSEAGGGFFNYILENEKGIDVKTPLFFALARSGHPIHEIRPLDMSLEDIFIQLTEDCLDASGEVSRNACNL
jgi:ABC-2 type transport system ATP-binding protein